MTREEFEYAIKSCGYFIYRGQTYYEESELIKAFEDMGLIKQEPSGDLISRQAVLETLNDMDNVLDEDRTIENYKELLKECYEVLPPVKPQLICEEREKGECPYYAG